MKRAWYRWLFLVLTLSVGLSSCESASDTGFKSQLVVQGFLYANEPLDSIVVRRTLEIGSVNESDRVSGAHVTISSPDSTYELVEDNSTSIRGRYIAPQGFIAIPGATYQLRIEAMGQVATASTTVPLAIHLDSVKLGERILSLTAVDTVVYPTRVSQLANPGIQLWWSNSPGAAGYGLEALAIDKFIDPIVIDLQNPLPDSTAYGRYRFFILSNSEQVVWLQFKRYGLNLVRALALDRNYEDYVLAVYLSGSQFNNNSLHVTGGLGVFGSAARATKQVYLK